MLGDDLKHVAAESAYTINSVIAAVHIQALKVSLAVDIA